MVITLMLRDWCYEMLGLYRTGSRRNLKLSPDVVLCLQYLEYLCLQYFDVIWHDWKVTYHLTWMSSDISVIWHHCGPTSLSAGVIPSQNSVSWHQMWQNLPPKCKFWCWHLCFWEVGQGHHIQWDMRTSRELPTTPMTWFYLKYFVNHDIHKFQ